MDGPKKLTTASELAEILKTCTVGMETVEGIIDHTLELSYVNFEKPNGYIIPFRDNFSIMVDGNYERDERNVTVLHEMVHGVLLVGGYDTLNEKHNLLTGELIHRTVERTEHEKMEELIEAEAVNAYSTKRDVLNYYLSELRKLNKISAELDIPEEKRKDIWTEIKALSGEDLDPQFWSKTANYRRDRAKRRGG